MTNKEAIELLDNLIGMIEDSQNNDYDRALRMAIEALKKEDKYRWHDLRKNPDDLPEKEGTYEVVEEYYSFAREEMTVFYEHYYYFPENRNFNVNGVDAHVLLWREIEPFEEEQA